MRIECKIRAENDGVKGGLGKNLYNVSSWQGRKHRSATCVISNEPLFKVHIMFFSDICTF